MRSVEHGSAADGPNLKERLEHHAEPPLQRGLVESWPAVAAGQRRFTLFAPISGMHPHPPDFERYPRYRDAWAALFGHYLVQREQEPAAHGPEQGQGVLARRR
ncbi:MAG: hypothetical protein ABW005_08130 [Burkholderiaceae bacterium]